MTPYQVLLVDDNHDAAETMAVYLAFSNFRVDIADNGSAALICCANNKYDIILMDIILPDINGYDLCRQLRTQGNTTIIIAFSGMEKDEHRQADFDDYILKPANPDKLEQLLLQKLSARKL